MRRVRLAVLAVVSSALAAPVVVAAPATPSCRTYELLPSSRCDKSAVARAIALLGSAGLKEGSPADLTVLPVCVSAPITRMIGSVRLTDHKTTRTLELATAHGATATIDAEDSEALQHFLGANSARIRIELAPGTSYEVEKPASDRGSYSSPKEIGCLRKREEVEVTSGELVFHGADAADGLLRVAPTRDLFYRVRYAVRAWPKPLDLRLCLSLAEGACAGAKVPAGEPGTERSGRLVSRHLQTSVHLQGVEGIPEPARTASLVAGATWDTTWPVQTDLAKAVRLSLSIDNVDNTDIPIEATMHVPVWAGLVDLLPTSVARIFRENYPGSAWFGSLMIAIVLLGGAFLARLKGLPWIRRLAGAKAEVDRDGGKEEEEKR